MKHSLNDNNVGCDAPIAEKVGLRVSPYFAYCHHSDPGYAVPPCKTWFSIFLTNRKGGEQ